MSETRLENQSIGKHADLRLDTTNLNQAEEKKMDSDTTYAHNTICVLSVQQLNPSPFKYRSGAIIPPRV